jgi:hypothetical protein
VAFVEAPVFTKHLPSYLSDEDFAGFQDFLAKRPEAGDLITGTGGFRKIRWGDDRRGKGKRGGLRIIYYLFLQDGQIWLMTLYGKNEAMDLTAKEKAALKEALEAERNERERRSRPRKG